MSEEIRIDIDEKAAAGHYSNLAVISHNENEFILDFIFAHPPKGVVTSRVITSPAHAKRLLKALRENLEMFEKQFGPVKDTPEPPKLGLNFSKN
jgi:hypothetical protein